MAPALSDMLERARELDRVRALVTTGQAKAIRKAAGLSRADFAALLEVAEATVWRWEEGHRTPRGEHALAYGRLRESFLDAEEAALSYEEAVAELGDALHGTSREMERRSTERASWSRPPSAWSGPRGA